MDQSAIRLAIPSRRTPVVCDASSVETMAEKLEELGQDGELGELVGPEGFINGGTPVRWRVLVWTIPISTMDDDWGYPYFRKPLFIAIIDVYSHYCCYVLYFHTSNIGLLLY